jgi:hypothetical protein
LRAAMLQHSVQLPDIQDKKIKKILIYSSSYEERVCFLKFV